jgi:hypothetical protein
MERYIRECDSNPSCDVNKPVEDMVNFDTDAYSAINENLKSVKRFEKALNTDGVVVDFENAVITGMPKDVTFFLICDLYLLMSNFGLARTPRECVAILLHEIGHDFTHIAYSYRQIRHTTVLMESFLELANKKGSVDDIKLMSKEKLGVDIKGDSPVEVAVNLTRALVSNSHSTDVVAFTDSEHLADQFAARFGLGAEIAVALNDIHRLYYCSPFINVLAMTLLSFVYTLLISFSIAFAGMVALVVGVVSTLLLIILPTINQILFGGDDTGETTYDSFLQRVSRIRLDVVRQMRENNLPKKVIKDYLKSIDKLNVVIKQNYNNKGIFEALGDISPWNIDKYVMTRTQRLLEELSENDLHISKNKLNLLYDSLDSKKG